MEMIVTTCTTQQYEEIGQLLIKENIHAEDVKAVLEGEYRPDDNWEMEDDLIGVDGDGDGWDAYDEKITGHDDQDPDDMPTQEEVDDRRAWGRPRRGEEWNSAQAAASVVTGSPPWAPGGT